MPQLIKFLKPVEYFSHTFLMVPYTYKNYKFEPLKINFWFILRVICILLLVTYIPVVDFPHYRDNYANLGLTLNTLHTVYYFMKLPVFVMLIFLEHFQKSSIVDFLNTAMQLDQCFEKITGNKSDYRKLKRFIIVLVVFGWFNTFNYAALLLIDYDGRQWNYLKIANLLLHVATSQTIVAVELQWITYQFILKVHIKRLNKYLQILTNYPLPPKRIMLDICYTSYRLYGKIVQQTNNLNTSYGWQMLMIVPMIMMMLIYNTYYMSKFYMQTSLHIVHELLTETIFFFLFVIPSSMTMRESKKFAWILGNIDIRIQEDPVFYDILNLLSLQSHHHRIKFSAVEVFSLDVKLVTLVFSTLTTYFVILLQNS